MTITGAPLTAEDLDLLFDQCTNWGRWGPDDQRGALNFITPELRLAALRLVEEGVTVRCALPLPTLPAPENLRPAVHFMTRTADAFQGQRYGFVGDYFAIAPHGWSTTHMDALCHLIYKDRMYNGFSSSEITSTGARKLSIEAGIEGVVGRGVLLDIPRLRGVPWLEPGEAINAAELERAGAAQGVQVGRGDILIIRTGRHARAEAHGSWNPLVGLAGLHPYAMPWLHAREIAVLGCDGCSDTFPSPVAGIRDPIHILALGAMGVHILDNVYTDALAEACAARGRWAFSLTVAPLYLRGGTASPVNPIAVF